MMRRLYSDKTRLREPNAIVHRWGIRGVYWNLNDVNSTYTNFFCHLLNERDGRMRGMFGCLVLMKPNPIYLPTVQTRCHRDKICVSLIIRIHLDIFGDTVYLEISNITEISNNNESPAMIMKTFPAFTSWPPCWLWKTARGQLQSLTYKHMPRPASKRIWTCHQLDGARRTFEFATFCNVFWEEFWTEPFRRFSNPRLRWIMVCDESLNFPYSSLCTVRSRTEIGLFLSYRNSSTPRLFYPFKKRPIQFFALWLHVPFTS